jgi:Mn2+/Fe2+ NRAMP family transporter
MEPIEEQEDQSLFDKHTLTLILLVLYYAMTVPVIKNLYARSCGPVISTGVLVSSIIAVIISVVLVIKMRRSKSYRPFEYFIILFLIYAPLAYALSLYYRNFC